MLFLEKLYECKNEIYIISWIIKNVYRRNIFIYINNIFLCKQDGIVTDCSTDWNDANRRKRRSSTTNIILVPDDEEDAYEFDPPQTNITDIPTFPTKSGITRRNATQECTDAITGSTFGKACLQLYPDMNYTVFIDECVTDIEV